MAKNFSPFVYIIIPNYHSESHTIECLETIFKQDYSNYKVIVVDNSKGDTSLKKLVAWCKGEIDKVETKFPRFVYPLIDKPLNHAVVAEDGLTERSCSNEKLLFIKANENNGFAAANNIALRFILRNDDFDWAWLLNNDTVIPPDCLKIFSEQQATLEPTIGIVGTKLLLYDNPNIYQGIGAKYNKRFGTVAAVGEGQIDRGQYDQVNIEEKVDYVIAASIFVSKPFLQSVGLMCEDYFFFFEELDWTFRGRQKGWRLGFLPGCRVLHKEGGSSTDKSEKSLLVDVAAVRNRVLFTRKFFPQYLPLVSISLAAVIINRIRRRQFNRIPILIKAVLTNQNPKFFVKSR